MLKGVVVDVDFDGTLVDSMFIWETAGKVYLRPNEKDPEENLQIVLKTMSLWSLRNTSRRKIAFHYPLREVIGVNSNSRGSLFQHSWAETWNDCFSERSTAQKYRDVYCTCNRLLSGKNSLRTKRNEAFFLGFHLRWGWIAMEYL